MKKNKRIISLMLAVIMCISLIPVSAFAQGEDNTNEVYVSQSDDKLLSYDAEADASYGHEAESIESKVTENVQDKISADQNTVDAVQDKSDTVNADSNNSVSGPNNNTLMDSQTDKSASKKPLLSKGMLKAPVPNAGPVTILNFKTTFLKNSSKADYDDTTGNYYLRPEFNCVNQNYLSFQVDYTLAGGDTSHEPGTVRIVIPAHLLETRNSTATDKEYATYVAQPPFPKSPTVADNEFNMDYNAADDTYVITNCKTINQSYIGTFTVTYNVVYTERDLAPFLNVCPYMVKDNTELRSFFASIEIDDDKDGTAEADGSTKCDEKFIYDTKVTGSISKEVLSKSEKWPGGNWGTAPADADDYFYVTYMIHSCVDPTQPFRFTVTDTPAADGGEVVAYLSGPQMTNFDYTGREEVDGYKGDINVPNGTLSTDPPEYGRNYPYEDNGNGSRYHNAFTYVLVKYPKSLVADGKNHTFRNNAAMELKGIDEAVPTIETATTDYTYIPLTFDAPAGPRYDLRKSQIAYEKKVVGALDMLRHGKVFDTYEYYRSFNEEQGYQNRAYVTGYPLTLRKGGDKNNPDDYGKREYRVELIDDMFFINEDYSAPLKAEDYEISHLGLNNMQYDWLPNEVAGAYRSVLDMNLDNYPQIDIYGTKDGKKWEKIGYYKVNRLSSNWGYADTMTQIDGSQSNDISGKGYIGVKAVYSTKQYSTTIQLEAHIALKPSERILKAIEGKTEVNVSDVNTLCVYDADGNLDGQKGTSSGQTSKFIMDRDKEIYGESMFHAKADVIFTELTRYTKTDKHVTMKNDPAKKRVVLSYTVGACEVLLGISNMKYEEAMAEGFVTPHNEGTFYDLLPLGVVPDVNTISIEGVYDTYGLHDYYYTREAFNTDVQIIENYQNTGRIMLIVHAKAQNGKNYYDNKLNSGLVMKFVSYYEWNDLNNFGKTVLNSAAYETANESLPRGHADDGGDITEAPLMSDLDGDGNPMGTKKNFVYMDNTYTINADTAAAMELHKYIKGGDMLSWTDGRSGDVILPAAGEYFYNLYYGSSVNTEVKNAILFDSLESFTPANATHQWKGTLKSIDVSQLVKKGAAPVIYYSTVDNLSIEDHHDIQDANYWSSQAPSDLSKVKAIAIDLRKDAQGNDFVIPEKESVTVRVNMIAPTQEKLVKELIADDAHAYNQAYISCDIKNLDTGLTATDKLTHYEYTQAGLKSFDAGITKKSDPETGTKDSPKQVLKGDDIKYTLTIANSAKYTSLKNVKIKDIIPDGLKIDMDNIQYWLNDDATDLFDVKGSTYVSVMGKDQELEFNITSLKPSEKINLVIPTTVEKEGTRFENTAHITSMNGIDVDIPSDTTYHKSPDPSTLTYHQIGADVKGVTTPVVPSDAVTPEKVTGISYGKDVNPLAAMPTTSWTTADGTSNSAPGTWEFSKYWTEDDTDPGKADITSNKIENITSDKDVYGKWTFTPDTYKVTYEVTPDTVYGVPDDAITPVDSNVYDYKDDVTVEDDLTTSWATSDGTTNGIPGAWTFTPWDKTDFNITENTTIHGAWTFTPNTYNVTYEVKGDAKYGTPSDGKAPTDDANPYDYKEKVTIKDDLTTSWATSDGTTNGIPGAWAFTPWDKTDFNITENTTIHGAWTFTPDTYDVTYEVKGDAKYGTPSDGKAPTDDANPYDYKEKVTVKDDLTTSWTTSDGTTGGIPGAWTFTPWDKTDFNITENTTIHGAWTFTPDTYDVTYEVKGDAKYGTPSDGKAPTDDANPYDYKEKVTVKDDLTTSWKTSDGTTNGIPGAWTFTPWDKTDFEITENTTIHGAWTFTPDTYKVTYEVKGDAKYGTPSDGKAPTDDNPYDYKEKVTVKDDLTTSWKTSDGTANGIPGAWTFTPWDKTDFNITENTTIHGAWTFTPNTYNVTYEVKGDAKYGTPSDGKAPTDDANPYDYKEKVTVKDDLTTSWKTSDGTTNGIPGAWTFTPWDKTDFEITENTTIHGAWTFTPDTYKVTYEVKGDNKYGTPVDSATPTDDKAYGYKDPVTVADKLSTKCDYAMVNGKKVKGTWSFVAWDKTDFKITENTTITGAWMFTPDKPNNQDKPDEPDDPKKPLPSNNKKGLAKTGDNSNALLWFIMMMSSSAALMGIVLSGKKKERSIR